MMVLSAIFVIAIQPVQGQIENQVIALDRATDLSHELSRKATRYPNSTIAKSPEFALDLYDVVQISGNNISVFLTLEQIHSVKLRNLENEFIPLDNISSTEWSLQDIDPGIYLLDVVAGSKTKTLWAYETILKVLRPEEQIIPFIKEHEQFTKLYDRLETLMKISTDVIFEK